jgi:hypothetical protein
MADILGSRRVLGSWGCLRFWRLVPHLRCGWGHGWCLPLRRRHGRWLDQFAPPLSATVATGGPHAVANPLGFGFPRSGIAVPGPLASMRLALARARDMS